MTGDSEFSFSYWNWLKATNGNWNMLFDEDKLGSIDGNGYVNVNSKYYGINNGWKLVCLYDEMDPKFKLVCDPTEPLGANGFTKLQRCQNREGCMPEQENSKWPSLAETREAINEMESYRSSSNNVFNKHNIDSFSNFLEGWDPSKKCSSNLLCLDDGIPRRLHNLVRTTLTKYTHLLTNASIITSQST